MMNWKGIIYLLFTNGLYSYKYVPSSLVHSEFKCKVEVFTLS